MKKITLILGILLLSNISYSQVNENPQNYQDSISLAKHLIDLMPQSDLKRQQEKFRYLSRTQPSQINSDVLLYIDEKIKLLGL